MAHPTDWLNFNANLQKPRFPDFDGRWRATECTGCPGALIHRALGCESGIFSSETLALFHEGYLHEDDVRARITAAGVFLIDYGQDGGLVAIDAPIVSHPDGFDPVLQELYEIKSIGDADDYRGIEQDLYDSHSGWQKQIQTYLRITGAKRCRVLIKVRKSGWILPPVIVEYDQKITDPIWGRVETASNALIQAAQNLPKQLQTCDNITSFLGCSTDYQERMFCPFYETHCSKKNLFPKSQANDVLNKLMENYAAAKMLSDDMESEMKSLRDQMKVAVLDILGEAKKGKVDSTYGSISIYETSYGSTNLQKAKELLTPAQYDEIFTRRTEPQAMRVTIKPEFQNAAKEATKA